MFEEKKPDGVNLKGHRVTSQGTCLQTKQWKISTLCFQLDEAQVANPKQGLLFYPDMVF